MIILSLLSTAMSSILYGIIATVVVIVLFYVLFKALDSDVVRSKAFIAVSSVLAFLLIIQFSMLIGAVQAKGEVDSAEIYLQQISENKYGIIDANESQALLNEVTNEFPLIGTYIGVCNFAGHSMEDIASAMADTMRSYLTTFIWHRVWWILGFIVTAGVLVCVIPGTGRRKGKNLSDTSYDDYTSSADTNNWGM